MPPPSPSPPNKKNVDMKKTIVCRNAQCRHFILQSWPADGANLAQNLEVFLDNRPLLRWDMKVEPARDGSHGWVSPLPLLPCLLLDGNNTVKDTRMGIN